MVENGLSVTIIWGMLVALTVAVVIVLVSFFDFGRFMSSSVVGSEEESAAEVATLSAESPNVSEPVSSARPVHLTPPPGTLQFPVVSIPQGQRSLLDPEAVDIIRPPEDLTRLRS